MSDVQIIEEKVDEVRLFMLYTLFGGDAKRVAIASQVDQARIESLAHDFNWKGRLNGRQALDTDQGQEAERVLNRITNYTTAERLSRVFGRLIDELDSDPSFARAFCTSVDADSKETSFNTKNLVELAKGLQIVNDIKYRALQDKQAQAADVINNAPNSAQFSLTIYKALATRFDRNISVDTTTEIVRAVADARRPDTDEEATG
jgi:hypothetical protein